MGKPVESSLICQSNKLRRVAKAVIYKNNLFLLQLRDNDNSISYPNKWSFFGGELDKGENFEVALKRELSEELNFSPEKYHYISMDIDSTTNCSINYYIVHCSLPDEELILGEGQSMRWFTTDEIMNLNSICRPLVLKRVIKKANKFIEEL